MTSRDPSTPMPPVATLFSDALDVSTRDALARNVVPLFEQHESAEELAAALGATTVRSRPHGDTLRVPGTDPDPGSGPGSGLGSGSGLPVDWFCKLRTGRVAAARNEWQRLHELPQAGVGTADPLFLIQHGPRTALGIAAVPGVEVGRLLTAPGCEPADRERFLHEVAVPTVRRLHAAGLCHRDLYWGHWFAESLRGPVRIIDLERCFRPRFRRGRWRRKDLAAMVASWPEPRETVAAWRKLFDAFGLNRLERRLVMSRARHMRTHVPKHGDPPAGVYAAEDALP